MLFKPLIFRRFAHCVGCGNELVFPISRSRAFPKDLVKSGAQAISNSNVERIFAQLSDEQREALDWGNEFRSVKKHDFNFDRQMAKANAAFKSSICKQCIMTRDGSITPVNIPQTATAFLGKIFHVIDAIDFPAGVPSSKDFHMGDIFVINRADLIVNHESQLSKLKHYVMETVFKPLGVPDNNVILTSGQRGWHLKKLAEYFVDRPKRNYFVGPTGSGKTLLVHRLSGTSQKQGPTVWPVPYTTQKEAEYKSLPEFRSRHVVDTPSHANGSSILSLILPNVLRKVIAGAQMMQRDPKYRGPKATAKSGQVVSVGGLVALEFPALDKRMPIHVFSGVGGLAHTDFLHTFKDLDKVQELNESNEPSKLKMRMHDSLGLQLERKLNFRPFDKHSRTRQGVVIKHLGFLQPFLFGDFPEDYEVTLWAPPGTDVGLRPEILPWI